MFNYAYTYQSNSPEEKSITKIAKVGSTNQKNVLTGVFKKPNAAVLPVIRNSDNALKNLLL